MEPLKIYTAGAMEIYGNSNIASKWRKDVEKYFVNKGHNTIIINPTNYYNFNKNLHKNEREVFTFDLYNVKKSNVIIVNLNDIRKSVGSCMECYAAYENNIPVIGFIDTEQTEEELIKIIHPWIYCCCNRIETGEDSLWKVCDYIENYYLF